MTNLKRTAVTAAVLATTALAGPATAGAYTNPGPGGPEQPIPPKMLAAPPASSNFDWGDAGIGAAGTLTLLGLSAGTVVLGRRLRHGQPATS